ncbi:suv3 RNA helicase isoform X1 [Megalopta genalis]|uniref:suv3 RNA helicase isoform X1 n=1 Tax=Megalopta genalis TaxID=115081 RepID=UPI003FD0C9F0
MITLKQLVIDRLKGRSNFLMSSLLSSYHIIFRHLDPAIIGFASVRQKSKKNELNVTSLFQPVPIKIERSNTNVGAELTGELNKTDVKVTMNSFASKKSIKDLAAAHGLDKDLLIKVLNDFRNYCVSSNSLPTDLHVTLNDIIKGAANVTDLFPYFLRYAKESYPHIDCMDDLKKISDLRHPPSWYPMARSKIRKIIFHAGPTNSGKTYHALERFMSAKSGVYCGPLKLLAAEVFNKCNSMGTACDLITGEEKRFAKNEMSPAQHIACSVEMVNVQNMYEVAVIDEIQLLRDLCRGWAWTRALLGITADELHLCGEYSALPIVQSICATTGETVEIKKYERLTDLIVEDAALGTLAAVEPGDCIVCFNKNDIFHVSQTLERIGKEVAVIYGSLPPGTKLAQAERFNDPNDKCKILVATNAIGMGLNLHIRRIIFYSVCQLTVNEMGEKEVDIMSVSSALQIAGRAGRFNTQWQCGYVTTFKPGDLLILKKLLNETPEDIKQVGLHPTADQIELYAYYLPNTPLSNLINIFIALCQVDDSLYFICNLEDFKFLADMIQHIPLNLRMKYIFCCAPVNRKMPFVCNMFLKYTRQCSKNEKITASWLCNQIKWPPKPPENISDLVHLESVFDVLDIYLWLSYRFNDIFPDEIEIRRIQKELDKIIEQGVRRLKILFQVATGSTVQDDQSVIGEYQPYDDAVYPSKSGKLTNRLISEGLLTPELLEQLRQEWSKKQWKENPKYDSWKKYNNKKMTTRQSWKRR